MNYTALKENRKGCLESEETQWSVSAMQKRYRCGLLQAERSMLFQGLVFVPAGM